MKRRTRWILVGGSAALGIAWFVGRSGHAPTLTADSADSNETAYGYEARDVVVRQTGEDGRLSYQLAAERVAQLPPDGRIEASILTMTYRPEAASGQQPGARVWTLTADSAQLPEDGSLLQLQGNVVATAAAPNATDPLVLRTPNLEYDTRKQTARTRAEVQFQWGAQQLTARGLRANIKLGTVELESQVHGRVTH